MRRELHSSNDGNLQIRPKPRYSFSNQTRDPLKTGLEILLWPCSESILSFMPTILEIERLALDLSETERATLIANLLDSLPPILSDDDEGIAEALRRDAELDANPGLAISLADLDADIRNRLK